MKYHVSCILLILNILCGGFLFAQTEFKIPDPPSVIYPVNDYAHVLSAEQIQNLNDKLIAYSDSTSTEILVCTIKTLDGDDINYVGAKWGEKWKVGQKGKNNGILLLIAVDDRKLAIQNGRGTEDVMTDMVSGLIIRNYMVPYLKSNDYYGAINSGTDQIFNVLQGKFKALPKSGNDDDWGGNIGAGIIIFIIILFVVILFGSGGNGGGTYYDRSGKRRYRDSWGSNFGGFGGWGSSGGWGGGSSSGGGFGGFGGGGSFGGGGASGSW
ncbi:MAG: TPM domain-containing protein [Flavobacteriaceae bacterium]|jgi:uncharacterized protein|nr:TPM domain-containing protein [Flavobacteriaceae bacterium]